MRLRSLVNVALAGTLILAAGPACASRPAAATPPPTPRAQTPPARSGPQQERPRPYGQVITDKAETKVGLFKVHRVDDKLFFEIPASELGKDMLLIGRVVEGVGLGGFSGGRLTQRIVRWERNGKQLHLRGVSFTSVAEPAHAIRPAVEAITRGPLITSFDIEAFGPDSVPVIEVTKLYTTNVPEMAPLRGVQSDRSFVQWFAAFPENVDVRATQTGVAPPQGAGPGAQPVTSSRQAHWSMLKLPERPMMPRLHDARVGYGSIQMTDYSRPEHRAENRRYIRRFRLEKRDPSAAVSEPVAPIVFWIDPVTPTWLVPWVRQGVEQWQAAFEGAGFSNAIVAREAPSPEVEPDWSVYDARHSMIYWRPSPVANATGGSVNDPRTGEIIKAEVNMYHNVMNLLRNWYFVQVSPLDARARRLPLPDSLMGLLVEYVVAHEVGHAIGFPHNMKASAMYPADSLRSRTFLERMGGHVATLMDYSRFNYVAQPEDSIPVHLLTPTVGPYDHFAVMWGHKPIPGASTPDDEWATLDGWARMQDTIPWYRFTTSDAPNDPHALTEAVGDADVVKSSTLGMRNLERVMASLLAVAERPGEDYSLLGELYGNAVAQWGRYMGHVAALVGGAYTQEKYGTGTRFEPVSRAAQRGALRFLTANAFQTPAMFVEPEILRRVEAEGAIQRIGVQQGRIVALLLSEPRLRRLVEYEAVGSAGQTYTVADLLADLRAGIWSELTQNPARIDVYRRNLQRQYLAAADRYLTPGNPAQINDARPVLRSELQNLARAVVAARARAADGMTRLHLQDVEAEIGRILDPRAARPVATIPRPPFADVADLLPVPFPFDPDGWLEMLGIHHPLGWRGLVDDYGIVEWESTGYGSAPPSWLQR